MLLKPPIRFLRRSVINPFDYPKERRLGLALAITPPNIILTRHNLIMKIMKHRNIEIHRFIDSIHMRLEIRAMPIILPFSVRVRRHKKKRMNHLMRNRLLQLFHRPVLQNRSRQPDLAVPLWLQSALPRTARHAS